MPKVYRNLGADWEGARCNCERATAPSKLPGSTIPVGYHNNYPNKHLSSVPTYDMNNELSHSNVATG